jgi:hypothetical protein
MDFYIGNTCAHVVPKISKKGEDYYIFVYDNCGKSRAEILRTLGRFASNPQLSFTWYDAEIVSRKVAVSRRLQKKRKSSERFSMR